MKLPEGPRQAGSYGARFGLACLGMAALLTGIVIHLGPAYGSSHEGDDDIHTATVAVVGDVILGGMTNFRAAELGPGHLLGELQPLRDADVAIANLESVATAVGERGVPKSEVVPYYFRARPETLEVLAAGGIDAVATANNHSGDYGSASLLEQNRLLDAMGIPQAGSGPTRAEACAPIHLPVGADLRVALFSADATEPNFAADERSAGTCHLPLDDPSAWADQFADSIAEARRSAHAVLFAVHWGANWTDAPSRDKQAIGHLLVEMGSDVVLGSNAHVLQGVEQHEGGVILHDLAHAVAPFDRPADSAIALLTISQLGVESVALDPFIADIDRARRATEVEADRIAQRLASLSSDLGTTLTSSRLELAPAPRTAPLREPVEVSNATGGLKPDPVDQPPPDCRVAAVPEDARIEPIRMGPLLLVGARTHQDRYFIPRLIGLETYWTVDEPVPTNLLLVPHGTQGAREPNLWMSVHEPCDWAWPTSRWEIGAIYRDDAGLRPPPEALSLRGAAEVTSGLSGPLDLSVGVELDGREVSRSPILAQVDLGIPVAASVTAVVVVVGIVAAGALFLIRRRRRGSRQPAG